MPAIEQNWQLFGYDLRQAEKFWRLAWQQCLWGDDSPIKPQLDEVVKVRLREGAGDDSEQQVEYYQAGLRIDLNTATEKWAGCEAILLPESQVLSKTLEIPLAAESELAAVMALELTANSPFPTDDTGSGWRLIEKTKHCLKVQLVIVSLGATMEELGDKHQCSDPSRYEVWASVDGNIIVLNGFGKLPRQQRYRKSLYTLSATFAYCLMMLVFMSALFAGSKYWQLSSVQALYEGVEVEAANAVSSRNRLTSANEMLITGSDLMTKHHSPHVELKRLSTLLSDKAWILDFSMSEDRFRIQGRGTNVADELRRLTDEPAYLSVVPTRDTSSLGGTGLQQFSFDIVLAEKK